MPCVCTRDYWAFIELVSSFSSFFTSWSFPRATHARQKMQQNHKLSRMAATNKAKRRATKYEIRHKETIASFANTFATYSRDPDEEPVLLPHP
eukprot:g6383.t1